MVKERAEMIAWKTHFKSTVKYKRLTKQYTSEDLEYFTEQWAYYHIQFENLTQTEEDSIDLLIDFKIRLENNRKQYKDLEIHEAQVREKLGNNMDQELDLENEEQRYLYEMLTSINKHRLDINKDVKELTEKYEKIQRSLNATREQREASTKIGGDRRIACEISVTTGRDHELGNIEKCLAAGYTEIVLVGSNERHIKSLTKFIDENLEESERGKVRYAVPESLIEYLDSLGEPPLPTEQMVRGYKVRTVQQPVDPKEANARRQAIVGVLARSLKK
jgi:hypothetical protein